MSFNLRSFLLPVSAAALAVAVSLSSVPAVANPAVALATVQGDGFTIDIVSPSAAVGELAHVEVTLVAKPGYKVNERYPARLELASPTDGLQVVTPVLAREDGQLEDGQRLRFRVPVKAARAGVHAVEGSLRFSVCNDMACFIDRQTLRAELTAR